MRSHRFFGVLTVAAGVLAALGAEPVRADPACRIGADELARQTTVPNPLVVVENPGERIVARTTCDSGRLDALHLVLSPGQQARLILVTHGHRPDARLELTRQHPGLDVVSWSVDNGELEDLKGGRIDLEIDVDARARVGLSDVRHLAWDDVEGVARTAVIRLDVRDSERMFRDDFRVDPTVGQFSF